MRVGWAVPIPVLRVTTERGGEAGRQAGHTCASQLWAHTDTQEGSSGYSAAAGGRHGPLADVSAGCRKA